MYEPLLQSFLEKKSPKPKLIVIYGPTGSGKTAMSIDIATQLKTEIISTDSRQIFKSMNIGTGKITLQEMQWVTHHMLDIINPDETYSVAEYKEEATQHIDNLLKKGKIPLLVWGTGLYIDSIIYDFVVGNIASDSELRKKLEQKTSYELYTQLQEIDPLYAQELHPNNTQYVARAIEVKLLTGKSKWDFRRKKELQYDVLFLQPDYKTRENLYARINTRVEQMFDEGLEKEVLGLIKKWYGEKSFGMKSIGYSEFFPYLRGEYDREECKNLIQQHSRNYAKRQCTWFRKYWAK